MERYQVIQTILGLFAAPRYLEIGVDAGETFRNLQAAAKVAVDPAFKFSVPTNVPGSGVAYHQVTSDEFFAASHIRSKFDVVYIDGLHTFEQVLRDMLNAIEFLSPLGVVIIDDITPNSYHAALPSLTEAFQVRDYVRAWHPELLDDATWMGDVYKVAFFVKTFMQQFDFATVVENHGQLLMWRRPREPEELGRSTVRDLAAVEFKDIVLQRHVFNHMPFSDIATCIRSRPGFQALAAA